MIFRFVFLCCFFFFGSFLHAQKDTITAVSLDSVLIKAVRISEKQIDLPLSVSKISVSETNAIRQQLSLQEYIQEVPGLFSQSANNFSQDIRISIRGFGARSAFGIRGIKIIVDGIPETTPDGQGQIDNLNLSIINNIEVIRGSSSALYGNASGGVINIQTKDTLLEPFITFGSTFGSYRLQQYSAATGYTIKNTTLVFQGNRTETNGYRVQSGFTNYNFNTRIKHRLSRRSSINFQANYTHSPNAEDAGSLTIEEVLQDRRQARQRNVDFNTGESVSQLKVGVGFTHRLNNNFTSNSYAFYSYRDFENKLPFEFGGIVKLRRNYTGFGSSLTYKRSFGSSSNKLQMGFDYALQQDQRKRFENLEGKQGSKSLDQLEQFSSFGIYVLDHYRFGKFLARFGARFDINNLKAEDDLLIDGNDTGEINLNAFSPSLGINYLITERHAFFGSFSTSFETPALSELSSNPEGSGGFNLSLKPQRATTIEFGVKSEAEAHSLQATLFYIETKDDLVPFELEAFPDRTFYRNAGSSIRKGLEFSYRQDIFKVLQFKSAYTYSNFKYESYEVASENLNGNQLPGIPEHKIYASLLYRANKIKILFETNYIGSFYADDVNATKIDGYTLANLNLGYQWIFTNFTIVPFFGIQNLFDKAYNDNIRINAFAQRYYEPASRRNYYGGVRIQF